MSILVSTLNNVMVRQNPGALGNGEYPFIAIALRFTSARRSSNWYRPTMGQIELFDIECANKWLMLNSIVRKITVWSSVSKQIADV